MRIAFLIKIVYYAPAQPSPAHTEIFSYETIDKFIKLNDENESLEKKIMKKYPTLNYIKHCDDNIVFDQFTKEKYLIVSNII